MADLTDTAEYFMALPEAEFREALRTPEFAKLSIRTVVAAGRRLCAIEGQPLEEGVSRRLLSEHSTWRDVRCSRCWRHSHGKEVGGVELCAGHMDEELMAKMEAADAPRS